MSRRSAEREAELLRLRDKTLAILRFISAAGMGTAFVRQAEDAVGAAFDRGDVRGLRLAVRDATQWAEALPASMKDDLDRRLLGSFGSGLSELNDGSAHAVQAVIARGVIRKDAEYRLLLERADAIHDDFHRTEELNRINELLAAADRSKRST